MRFLIFVVVYINGNACNMTMLRQCREYDNAYNSLRSAIRLRIAICLHAFSYVVGDIWDTLDDALAVLDEFWGILEACSDAFSDVLDAFLDDLDDFFDLLRMSGFETLSRVVDSSAALVKHKKFGKYGAVTFMYWCIMQPKRDSFFCSKRNWLIGFDCLIVIYSHWLIFRCYL